MAINHITPTGVERVLERDEIIVSKTDLKGRITYANGVFERISGYSQQELLNKAHNIVRHPDMPRCVFKVLWDTIASGNEIFAYVLNLCKNGDHYWVFAHVTPSYDDSGRIIAYHSNRRSPPRKGVEQIAEVYKHLLTIERRYDNPQRAMEASLPAMTEFLKSKSMPYEEFVFSLT